MENVKDICFKKDSVDSPIEKNVINSQLKTLQKNLLPTVIIVRYVFASLHILPMLLHKRTTAEHIT